MSESVHRIAAAKLPRPKPNFDFLVGTWNVQNRRLRMPLTGSADWYETGATATSTTFHNGRISIDEMWYSELGFAGSSIRTYTPDDDSWTIYWVNSNDGRLQPPVVGHWGADATNFEATGPDTYEGRDIVARYHWHSICDTRATWEQAFSLDHGATWETNWIMTWSRM